MLLLVIAIFLEHNYVASYTVCN